MVACQPRTRQAANRGPKQHRDGCWRNDESERKTAATNGRTCRNAQLATLRPMWKADPERRLLRVVRRDRRGGLHRFGGLPLVLRQRQAEGRAVLLFTTPATRCRRPATTMPAGARDSFTADACHTSLRTPLPAEAAHRPSPERRLPLLSLPPLAPGLPLPFQGRADSPTRGRTDLLGVHPPRRRVLRRAAAGEAGATRRFRFNSC